MFRPSCRSSSPFSLTDLDMWDTKSRFTAQVRPRYTLFVAEQFDQSSCFFKSVCSSFFRPQHGVVWQLSLGQGLCPKLAQGDGKMYLIFKPQMLIFNSGCSNKILPTCSMYSSTSGSTGAFRQNDPGLRKWQSLSHLTPETPTRSFPPSPGAELRAARGASSFRQSEVGQWLQDAHERLDTQLERLTTRNSQLRYNISTAQLLDMKHKVSKKVHLDANVSKSYYLFPCYYLLFWVTRVKFYSFSVLDRFVYIGICFSCTQSPVILFYNSCQRQ